MNRAADKVAIVTGAASPTGIGHAIAALLASEGASVVLTDKDVVRGQELAKDIGANAIFLEQDVRNEDDWKRIVSETTKRFGKLDILVNNAGVTGSEARQNIETVTLEAWRDVQAVNVEGVVLGCKWAISVMKEHGGGAIVNISSMAALIATASLPAYGASKAAVRQVTQTVAQHCAANRYGIRCNSVHPGVIATELIDGAFTEEQLARFRSSIPNGEFGTPEDVAQAVLYLASKESNYLTGTRLVVDGGSTMQ